MIFCLFIDHFFSALKQLLKINKQTKNNPTLLVEETGFKNLDFIKTMYCFIKNKKVNKAIKIGLQSISKANLNSLQYFKAG